jgi:hypothetical protein
MTGALRISIRSTCQFHQITDETEAAIGSFSSGMKSTSRIRAKLVAVGMSCHIRTLLIRPR